MNRQGWTNTTANSFYIFKFLCLFPTELHNKDFRIMIHRKQWRNCARKSEKKFLSFPLIFWKRFNEHLSLFNFRSLQKGLLFGTSIELIKIFVFGFQFTFLSVLNISFILESKISRIGAFSSQFCTVLWIGFCFSLLNKDLARIYYKSGEKQQ